ncbi:MAG: MBL fold metallo-hydrolase [Pseudomonadales bacterium]|nr:MBL fold metallo-hydrolase [Pseudomonadales bacterium]
MTVASLIYPFDTPPASEELLRIRGGRYWLRIPIPFSLDHINLWLVEGVEGWVIVDTGVNSDDTQANWEKIFKHDLKGKPVNGVVVTHMHPDHVGMAGWLCERWQTDLTMTKTE